MSDVDHDHTSMSYLTVTLVTDKFCENKAYSFKISTETEEIVFKILPSETKTFVLPKYEHFSIQALGAPEPGVSTTYSQQDGLMLEEDIQINICKKYHKQDEKKTISGQIYWEFDNEGQIAIPDVVSVYVVNDKDEIIKEQKVSKDFKERWSYEFILPKYDYNGMLNHYVLKSEILDDFYTMTLGDNIKNIAYKALSVHIKVCSSSDYESKDMKMYKIIATNNAPLPKQDTIAIFGQGVKSFMPIKFNGPGVYHYCICPLNHKQLPSLNHDDWVDVELSIVASDLELELESINYIKCGRFYDKDCARFND